MRFLILLLLVATLPLRADDLVGSAIRPISPARREFPSPAGKWTVVTFLTGKEGLQRGYSYFLRNRKNGESFFSEPHPRPDDILAQGIDASWSPDSRYVALTIYYGRAVEGVVVIHCGNVPRYVSLSNLDEWAFLRPEDRSRYDGYNRMRQYVVGWDAPRVLRLGGHLEAPLKNPSGEPARLSSEIIDTIALRAERGTLRRRETTFYNISN